MRNTRQTEQKLQVLVFYCPIQLGRIQRLYLYDNKKLVQNGTEYSTIRRSRETSSCFSFSSSSGVVVGHISG